jgi:hypothetical protein
MSLVDNAAVARSDVVESLVTRMSSEYDVAPEVVRERAVAIFERFADSRVQSFIPLLVERHVRDWLRQVRALSAALPDEQPAS